MDLMKNYKVNISISYLESQIGLSKLAVQVSHSVMSNSL